MHVAAVIDNNGLGIRYRIDQLHALLYPQDEDTGRECVSISGEFSDNTGTENPVPGRAGFRVENMVLANPVLYEKVLVVTGRGYGRILERDHGNNAVFITGIADTNMPGTIPALTDDTGIATGTDKGSRNPCLL